MLLNKWDSKEQFSESQKATALSIHCILLRYFRHYNNHNIQKWSFLFCSLLNKTDILIKNSANSLLHTATKNTSCLLKCKISSLLFAVCKMVTFKHKNFYRLLKARQISIWQFWHLLRNKCALLKHSSILNFIFWSRKYFTKT